MGEILICSANTAGKFEPLKKFIGKLIITIGGGKDKIYIVEQKESQASDVFSVQSNTKYLDFRPGMTNEFSSRPEEVNDQHNTLPSNSKEDINNKKSLESEKNEEEEEEEEEIDPRDESEQEEEKMKQEEEEFIKELTESKKSKFLNSNAYQNDADKQASSKFTTNNNFISSQGFREQISQIAKGKHHLLKLTSEGRVYASGESYFGVVGLGGAASSEKSVAIPVLKSIPCKQIACGLNHSLALSYEGDVYSWGLGFEGQLGCNPEQKVFSSPRYITLFYKRPVKFIACGHNYSLAVTENVLD